MLPERLALPQILLQSVLELVLRAATVALVVVHAGQVERSPASAEILAGVPCDAVIYDAGIFCTVVCWNVHCGVGISAMALQSLGLWQIRSPR